MDIASFKYLLVEDAPTMPVDINQTGYGVLYGKELYTENIHIGRRHGEEPHTERNRAQELYTVNIYIQKGATHKAEFYIKRSYARK